MITITGGLPTLNEYINAERSNKYGAAKMKKDATNMVAWQAKTQVRRIEGLNDFTFIWTEPTKRKDPDNIASGVKYIFDGLIRAGIMDNDGWSQVNSITHQFVHGDSQSVEVKVCSTQ